MALTTYLCTQPFLKKGHSRLPFHLFLSFHTVQLLKNLAASEIRTWIVGAVGENADHYTTTTAQFTQPLQKTKPHPPCQHPKRKRKVSREDKTSKGEPFSGDSVPGFKLFMLISKTRKQQQQHQQQLRQQQKGKCLLCSVEGFRTQVTFVEGNFLSMASKE